MMSHPIRGHNPTDNWIARHATPEEEKKYHQFNGVLIGPWGHEFFFVSPMALAERMAAAMNLAERFSQEEIEAIGKTLIKGEQDDQAG